MFERNKSRKTRSDAAPAPAGHQDRRQRGDDARGPRLLRWLRNLFQRPFRLRWRGGIPRLAFVDRRGATTADHPRALDALRAELERLLAEGHRSGASEVLMPLRVVHHELGRRGWPGVEWLPARLLAKALAQAQLVAGGSPALAPLIDRLRLLKAAAEVREDRKARLQAHAQAPQIEVSEATVEEFDAMERSWVGVLPPPDPARAGPAP
ncbi:MAG: hypothetical protein KGJ30_15940, partial [Burkholderiales bacterium]|nr:hypothetical protein [Burkholderiales bacterium]